MLIKTYCHTIGLTRAYFSVLTWMTTLLRSWIHVHEYMTTKYRRLLSILFLAPLALLVSTFYSEQHCNSVVTSDAVNTHVPNVSLNHKYV